MTPGGRIRQEGPHFKRHLKRVKEFSTIPRSCTKGDKCRLVELIAQWPTNRLLRRNRKESGYGKRHREYE